MLGWGIFMGFSPGADLPHVGHTSAASRSTASENMNFVGHLVRLVRPWSNVTSAL
jgi:hypothetical protein